MINTKNRIRNLSTRWLTPFKIFVFCVYITLCLVILYSSLKGARGIVSFLFSLVQGGLYAYIFYRMISMTAKLYRIEFDSEFLYVLLKGQDLIIPLENIESVEVSTLGGVYKVNLYNAEQLGNHFYFKLSLLYPLNFSSKDALVNVLRKNIDYAKTKVQVFQPNALHS